MDSASVEENREAVIDLALQKARCLRKLYRMQESVEVLAGVDAARKYYELSYKYDPRNISALSSIGYCYERMKNYDKALEYYERYKKVGKPGTAGYRFVEESIEYVKREKFMEE